MSTLRTRLYEKIDSRREKILKGGINCIPLPFPRFRKDWPGIEQEKIYLISGGTKSAKSMITNYLFVINTIMYCYHHPGQIKANILYFPLEESQEEITLKIMAFFLYYISGGKIIISPLDIMSTNEKKPLPEHIREAMNTPEFSALMDLFESMVTFYEEDNRIGIKKTLDSYVKAKGTIHTKPMHRVNRDEFGNIVSEEDYEGFDYYVPNDPDEYTICIIDHLSLLTPIRGEDLRLTLSNFAKDCVLLRKRFRMIFACVQQQNIESTGLEAVKADRLQPTVAGLADCKDFGKAANMMLGILNPYYFEKRDYLKYDITKLKGAARFLQIAINRNGVSGGICPLLFIGETCTFKELPKPDDTEEMKKVYDYVNDYENGTFSFMIFNNLSHKKLGEKKIKNYLCKLLNK